jgi:hypothetical protein
MQQGALVCRARGGVAMLVTLIFLAMFACMALAVVTAADANLVAARNRVDCDQAAALAETGLLMLQQHLGGLVLPATHDAEDVHRAIAQRLLDSFGNSSMLRSGMIQSTADGVTVPPLVVAVADGQSGTIEVLIRADGGALDHPTIHIQSTGRFGKAVRAVSYQMATQSSLDDLARYGIASRSPVEMKGNASVRGANDDQEGSVLSATRTTLDAVTLTGHVEVSGDVVVSGAGTRIDTHGSVTIGGDEIRDAPEPAWPQANTALFEAYATHTFDGDTSGARTLTNCRIPAGMNPTFSANTTVQGVLYVESPNKVTFSGNATVRGTIVMQDHAAGQPANEISFAGNVQAYDMSTLPQDAEFEGLRDLTSTFLLAPGANAKFAGNFGTINGWMVASGYEFSGSAGGTVHGAILNLADSSFRIDGNVQIAIDKSGNTSDPAGLTASRSLVCVRGSYSE